MKVILKEKELAYKGFFTLEKSRLQFEKKDGTLSEEVVRESFYRGDSVAALVYDLKAEKVLLVRQFRYPVYTVDPENAWVLELVAGSCEPGEDPLETLLRELAEEVNLNVNAKDVKFVCRFFVSPGGTSERIYLYTLETNLAGYDEKRGGVDEENEDIEIVLLDFSQALRLLEQQQIYDAKTIIALQQLKLVLCG